MYNEKLMEKCLKRFVSKGKARPQLLEPIREKTDWLATNGYYLLAFTGLPDVGVLKDPPIPDWHTLVKEPVATVTFSPCHLKESLKPLIAFVTYAPDVKRYKPSARLCLGATCSIESKVFDGSSCKIGLPDTQSQGEISVTLKPIHLWDVVRTLADLKIEEATLNLSDKYDPLHFTAPGATALLMPMREK